MGRLGTTGSMDSAVYVVMKYQPRDQIGYNIDIDIDIVFWLKLHDSVSALSLTCDSLTEGRLMAF